MKNLFLLVLTVFFAGTIVITNTSCDSGGDDNDSLLALLLLSSAPIMQGSETDINIGSAAAGAASSAISAAVATTASTAGTINWDSETLTQTVYCSTTPNMGLMGNYFYPTDQGNGSATLSIQITGTATTSSTDISSNLTATGSVTYNNCTTVVEDVYAMQTWDGTSTMPTMTVTLNGTLNMSDTNVGNGTVISSGSYSNCSYEMTMTSSGTSNGTTTSTGLTVLDALNNTLLDNQPIDLTTGMEYSSQMTQVQSGTSPSCSYSTTSSGNGTQTISGTIGGNTINVRWPYSYSYDLSF